MSIPIYQVDSFATQAFAGNPAGVCLLEGPADASWMQRVAAEMNLSETAFVWPLGELRSLRWFTPAVEVDLCGHATLATAHVLWNEAGADPATPLCFETASGVLTATQASDTIELDFPLQPVTTCTVPPGLEAAIGYQPEAVGFGGGDLVVMLKNEDLVQRLVPDISKLKQLEARGICVTAAAELKSPYDFVSRFFAPKVGVDEDPVTGSAHCALAAFWQERLGRSEMVGYQASERGGQVKVRVQGDRVILGGSAVTVIRGELLTG